MDVLYFLSDCVSKLETTITVNVCGNCEERQVPGTGASHWSKRVVAPGSHEWKHLSSVQWQKG